jgi:hypothetical protein
MMEIKGLPAYSGGQGARRPGPRRVFEMMLEKARLRGALEAETAKIAEALPHLRLDETEKLKGMRADEAAAADVDAAALRAAVDREAPWSVRARDGGVVCGTDSFRSKQIQTSGIRAIRFRNWLAELCGEAKAQAIVYRGSDAAAHRAWIPHLLEYSQRAGVPLQSITSGRVKKFTVGRGSAPMESVLAAVKDMSYQPGNENAERSLN